MARGLVERLAAETAIPADKRRQQRVVRDHEGTVSRSLGVSVHTVVTAAPYCPQLALAWSRKQALSTPCSIVCRVRGMCAGRTSMCSANITHSNQQYPAHLFVFRPRSTQQRAACPPRDPGRSTTPGLHSPRPHSPHGSSGALSRSSLTIRPRGNGSWLRRPGKATPNETANRRPATVKAKIGCSDSSARSSGSCATPVAC